MSLVNHEITLDVKTYRSVEPIQLFTDNASAYSVTVKVTDGGKEMSLSEFNTFTLEIEGVSQQDFPVGTLVNNRIVFELSNAAIQEGWSVCVVTMTSSNTGLRTQVFQIYKEVFNTIQVDETSFRRLTDTEMIILSEVAQKLTSTNIDTLKNITSADVASLRDLGQANTTVLKGITAADMDKLRTGVMITNIMDVDPATEDYWCSFIDVHGVINILHKVTDINVNQQSVLGTEVNGWADIYSENIVSEIEVVNGNNTVISNGTTIDTATDPTAPVYTVEIDPGVEKVKVNGSAITPTTDSGKSAVNINALAGITVNDGSQNTNIDASNSNPRVVMTEGDGIALTADQQNHGVTIAVDPSKGNVSWPITKINVPSGVEKENGYVPVLYGNTFVPKSLTEALGIDVEQSGGQVNVVSEITNNYNFSFDDFTTVTAIQNAAFLPFIYGSTNQKITWGNLISLFETYFSQRHRTVYYTKTLANTAWSGDTATLTLSSSDLSEEGLTAAIMVGDHVHAHIHPEPDSVYNFANYGIYCSGVEAQNGAAVFTFKRNNPSVPSSAMPSLNITIEVRLDDNT